MFPEATMILVVGDDKTSGKPVEVARADNETEAKIILREERRNYRNLRMVNTPLVQARQKMRYPA